MALGKENDRLFTVKEAADILRVHRKTLYKMIIEGKITAHRISERKILILESEIRKYLDSRAI